MSATGLILDTRARALQLTQHYCHQVTTVNRQGTGVRTRQRLVAQPIVTTYGNVGHTRSVSDFEGLYPNVRYPLSKSTLPALDIKKGNGGKRLPGNIPSLHSVTCSTSVLDVFCKNFVPSAVTKTERGSALLKKSCFVRSPTLVPEIF